MLAVGQGGGVIPDIAGRTRALSERGCPQPQRVATMSRPGRTPIPSCQRSFWRRRRWQARQPAAAGTAAIRGRARMRPCGGGTPVPQRERAVLGLRRLFMVFLAWLNRRLAPAPSVFARGIPAATGVIPLSYHRRGPAGWLATSSRRSGGPAIHCASAASHP